MRLPIQLNSPVRFRMSFFTRPFRAINPLRSAPAGSNIKKHQINLKKIPRRVSKQNIYRCDIPTNAARKRFVKAQDSLIKTRKTCSKKHKANFINATDSFSSVPSTSSIDIPLPPSKPTNVKPNVKIPGKFKGPQVLRRNKAAILTHQEPQPKVSIFEFLAGNDKYMQAEFEEVKGVIERNNVPETLAATAAQYAERDRRAAYLRQLAAMGRKPAMGAATTGVSPDMLAEMEKEKQEREQERLERAEMRRLEELRLEEQRQREEQERLAQEAERERQRWLEQLRLERLRLEEECRRAQQEQQRIEQARRQREQAIRRWDELKLKWTNGCACGLTLPGIHHAERALLPLSNPDYLYGCKWEALKALSVCSDVPPLIFEHIPWPMLHLPHNADQITRQDIEVFLNRRHRASGAWKTPKEIVVAEMLKFHSDKFNAAVMPMVLSEEQAKVAEGAAQVVRILLAIKRELRS